MNYIDRVYENKLKKYWGAEKEKQCKEMQLHKEKLMLIVEKQHTNYKPNHLTGQYKLEKRQKAKIYREQNKDKVSEYNKLYREKNPNYMTEYYQKNPHKLKEKNLKQKIKRSQKYLNISK